MSGLMEIENCPPTEGKTAVPVVTELTPQPPVVNGAMPLLSKPAVVVPTHIPADSPESVKVPAVTFPVKVGDCVTATVGLLGLVGVTTMSLPAVMPDNPEIPRPDSDKRELTAKVAPTEPTSMFVSNSTTVVELVTVALT